MSNYYGYFDSDETSDTSYNAAENAAFLNLLSTGVTSGYLNELAPSAGTGLQVNVATGAVVDKGYFFIEDADVSSLTIDAEAAGSNRIDIVVVDFDTAIPENKLDVVKGTGTTGTATAPTLADTATHWQVPIATVNVTGGTLVSVVDARVIGGARVVTTDPTTNITVSNGLTGGGTLEADRIIAGVDATTSVKGVVQLSSATTSTSETTAATPNAVKTVADAKENNLDADQKHYITRSSSVPSDSTGSNGDVHIKII